MSHPVYLVSLRDKYLTEERRSIFERSCGDRELVYAHGRENILPLLDRVEIAVGEIPRDLIATAPALKWYQQLGTGVDWLLRHPQAVGKPFVLTNCSDRHCVVIADHMFALILACARGLPQCIRMKDQGHWDRPGFDDEGGLFELRDQTILVVGLGSIGQKIIQRARAFEMRILGLRADPSKSVDGVERIVGPAELDAILPEADLVAVSIPHTAQTDKMFGASAFAAMKESAFFFNVGRGGTVDEAALSTALHADQIAGAGLDVFSEEPLPDSSPLWQAPNLIMTPHLGGVHRRLFECFLEAAMENVVRHAEGRELLNVVDKRAGY